MSFLSRLFGGKPATPEAPSEGKTTGQIEYKGFVIRAVPFKEKGQFQTAGVIEREVDGVTKSVRFVRADRSTMLDEITELALHKGKMMVDEQGESLFR